jgi:hypothetical protein
MVKVPIGFGTISRHLSNRATSALTNAVFGGGIEQGLIGLSK